MNLSLLLAERANRHPDRPFVLFERQPDTLDTDGHLRLLTYGEFDRLVNRTANHMVAIGLERGDMFNIHLPNSISFLALWFAGARIGAVMMPTNTLSSAAELEYLLEHSGSKVSYCTLDDMAMMQGVAQRCPRLEHIVGCDPLAAEPHVGSAEQSWQVSPADPQEARAGGHELAAIMYTSGTTSKPKGVMVTHANYLKAGETVADAIELSPHDRHFVVLPLFHGNAQYYSFMSALVRGASVALMDRFSASRYMAKCAEHGCTVASLFAAPMRMLLAQPEMPGDRANRLRIVLYAQNLTEAQMTEWERRFEAPLCQLWGMTETMGPPLMNPLEGERRNRSMGRPIGGYRVELVDENANPVAPGAGGEIRVQGEPGRTLMRGYYRHEEATREALREGWLYTGDRARQDDDGFFYFIDRAKDMIKRSGENVAASEVEAVLLGHPAVYDCAVVGLPDEIRDEQVVAVVVLAAGRAVTDTELIEFCRDRLASFRVPGQVIFRDALPRTAVGKIQKHLIRAELMKPDHAGQ